ncbi:cell division protein ZapA [Brevundimonas sp.]|uniref:cell division protein ZapA n=1 Tax=Brevundimonas sp. TaxID=1871086 RepID=UPI002EDA86B3
MATVTVEVNGRPYAVGCADGQEERVRILARQFDTHVRQIAGDVGHVGDLRLFLMASLMLADELQEARQRLENGQGPAAQDGPIKAPPPPASDGVAEALNAVAARIEKICQTI